MVRFEIALSWMMFVEVLASYPIIYSTENGIPCQHRPCRCVNKFKVNCSHSLLSEIPPTIGEDANILVMDASNNHLSRLNASVLPSQLKSVQLRNNRIKTVAQGDLYMLKALIVLHLDMNNINAIHPEALLENKRLEILTLSGNQFQISEAPKYTYKQPFINAPELRVLDVSNCSFRIISGVMFAKLPKLEELRLSHNHIQSLEDGTFHHLNSLRSLLLRGNLLSKIHWGAFNSLSKLEVLDLADNYLSFLDEPKLFRPLIALVYLDLSGNGLKHLHQHIFTNICSLKVLHLNRNLLNTLDETVFNGITQLSTLDLSDNSIHTLPRHIIFCKNKDLSYIKLTNSFMTCDNCSIWDIWEWRNKRNISAFYAKCNGRNIDDFFNSHQKLQEMLQSVTNCSVVPNCEPIKFEELPEPPSSSLHIYAIAGIVFLSLLLSGTLATLILFRRYVHSKRKQVISVSAVPSVHGETNNPCVTKAEEPHITEELKKRQELYKKAEEERLQLQRELYFQHQKSLKKQQQQRYRETLERNRNEREAKSQGLKEERLNDNRSSKTSRGVDHNIRHSYQEEDASRLPSVTDDEREWCRADTLPVRDKYKSVDIYAQVADESVCYNKKAENRRYSVGEAYRDKMEDDYWHAKKSDKGSKSTDGIITLCIDPTEVAFCQNTAPVYAETCSDQVL